MNVINDSYAVSHYYNNTVQQNHKNNAERVKSKTAKKSETAVQTSNASRPKLSNRAQAFLEKLRKTYSNMDFMVADFDKGDEAKEILSRCTKEVSVMFSSEELEKMASDEKYAKEYMDRVQGALRMSEQINKQFGYESAFGNKSDKGEITKIGFSFNKDGTMSIFAELEKAMKKTTLQASSADELFKKINEIAWNKVREDKKAESNRVDVSI